MTEFIAENLKTKIIAETDILIMGCGPAGFTAAITAARMGARVMIIERHGHLGGLGTGGLVLALVGNLGSQGEWIKGGIYTETVDRLKSFPSGLAVEGDFLIAHPEYLKLIYQRMLIESGVRILTNTQAVGCQTEDGAITSVMVENKSGRGAIRAKVFIDCTGDADSARWCGVPFELLPGSQLCAMTLVYRLGNVDRQRASQFQNEQPEAYNALRRRGLKEAGVAVCWSLTPNEGEVWGNDAHIGGCDCSNAEDLMRAEFESREKVAAGFEFYKAHVPGFEKATWVDTAAQMGARESRRIRGKHWLTADDCDSGRRFKDSILLNNSAFIGRGTTYSVPYRCLVPEQGPRNLLFAGRCVSVEHAVIDRIREIPSCACLGQGAGTGAVLALNGNHDVSSVNTQDLKNALLKMGAILETQF